MERTCPNCGKIFYSDTEFREHQTYEMLSKSTRQQETHIRQINTALELLIILELQRQDIKLSFEQAGHRYLDYYDRWQQVVQERHRRDSSV